MYWYEEHYQKSIQMIKLLDVRITVKDYDIFAKKHDLLSSETMKLISRKNFKKLIRTTISGKI